MNQCLPYVIETILMIHICFAVSIQILLVIVVFVICFFFQLHFNWPQVLSRFFPQQTRKKEVYYASQQLSIMRNELRILCMIRFYTKRAPLI